MGYTIKQKIEICLKSESDPSMTQEDLAKWAQRQYNTMKQPSQTTISRILSNKNDLIASKETDFQLVRRRKRSNPILRQILTEWVTQSIWENIPVTTPILQTTANSIWTRLPLDVKDGTGIFNQKWCNQFMKKLNISLTGTDDDIRENLGYSLNKIWYLDEKLDLKLYLDTLIQRFKYRPRDIFTIDEFQLFYSLPLDQIFDINSIDKGLKQLISSTENSLTVMLGTNLDGSEKLTPLIVGKYDKFDVSQSSNPSLRNYHRHMTNDVVTLMNKLTEVYGVFYKNNINKWITSTMFHNYLLTLDHKLANSIRPRRILIILDDSSSHRILNLKFNNIKLVYLKNNTHHKSLYNSLYNGANFDYCPMNFGIVYEFKILYRLQQYVEMMNIQRNSNVSIDTIDLNTLGMNNSSTDVLSETDYNIPIVKAIEWIKTAWDRLSVERILMSWTKTHLINIKKLWPQDININNKVLMLSGVDLNVNYNLFHKVINYLNVVLPWETDEVLGLVNERGKPTLNYISIEEIITSCLLESQHQKNSNVSDYGDNWMMTQMLNSLVMELSTQMARDLEMNTMSINALLAAAEMQPEDYSNGTKRSASDMLDSEPITALPLEVLKLKYNKVENRDLLKLVRLIIDGNSNGQMKLSQQTIHELKNNLRELQNMDIET